MTEREEENPSGSLWQLVAALILFNIISRALEAWLVEPAALGIGSFSVMLTVHWFDPSREVGFLKWALGSLLFSAWYVGLIFGVPYLICDVVGAAITWGLMGFVLFMSFRFVPEFFFKKKAKDELWKWCAVSVGVGLLLAFLAYTNPKGFCNR